MKLANLKKEINKQETELYHKWSIEQNDKNKRFISGQLDMIKKIKDLFHKP